MVKSVHLRTLGRPNEVYQQACIFGNYFINNSVGASNGSISVLAPVSEKLYRRLYSLYSRIVTSQQHAAGLNPRGYRHVHHHSRPLAAANTITSGPPGPKSILDGDLLTMYLNLSYAQQLELAKATGSNIDRIYDDLLELSSRVGYF